MHQRVYYQPEVSHRELCSAFFGQYRLSSLLELKTPNNLKLCDTLLLHCVKFFLFTVACNSPYCPRILYGCSAVRINTDRKSFPEFLRQSAKSAGNNSSINFFYFALNFFCLPLPVIPLTVRGFYTDAPQRGLIRIGNRFLNFCGNLRNLRETILR